MDSHSDLALPDEPDDNNPFLVLWFLMGLVWGPLLWPLAIANALAGLGWAGGAGRASSRSWTFFTHLRCRRLAAGRA